MSRLVSVVLISLLILIVHASSVYSVTFSSLRSSLHEQRHPVHTYANGDDVLDTSSSGQFANSSDNQTNTPTSTSTLDTESLINVFYNWTNVYIMYQDSIQFLIPRNQNFTIAGYPIPAPQSELGFRVFNDGTYIATAKIFVDDLQLNYFIDMLVWNGINITSIFSPAVVTDPTLRVIIASAYSADLTRLSTWFSHLFTTLDYTIYTRNVLPAPMLSSGMLATPQVITVNSPQDNGDNDNDDDDNTDNDVSASTNSSVNHTASIDGHNVTTPPYGIPTNPSNIPIGSLPPETITSNSIFTIQNWTTSAPLDTDLLLSQLNASGNGLFVSYDMNNLTTVLIQVERNITVDNYLYTSAVGAKHEIVIVGNNNTCVVSGELFLDVKEVQPVIKMLRSYGIFVTALHQHFFYQQTEAYFLHFQIIGNAITIAHSLNTVVLQQNLFSQWEIQTEDED